LTDLSWPTGHKIEPLTKILCDVILDIALRTVRIKVSVMIKREIIASIDLLWSGVEDATTKRFAAARQRISL
jgi:hypothetical protein